jgi:hypothetical protein
MILACLVSLPSILWGYQSMVLRGSPAPLTSRLRVEEGFNGGDSAPMIKRHVLLARDWQNGVLRALVILPAY